MGNESSRNVQTPPPSCKVLQAELACLNQGEVCEMEIIPNADVNDEDFESSNQQRFKRCKKYSVADHSKHFIPVNDFCLDHLPKPARHPAVLSMIKTQIPKAVRLLVTHTSKDRPVQFCCASGLRVGTGYWSTSLGPSRTQVEGYDNFTFFIKTANHVVFDDEEVKNTKVEFFFDDDDDRSTVIKAKGERMIEHSVKEDKCEFICKIVDKKDQLKMSDRCKDIQLYYNINVNDVQYHNIAFTVSHPHGTAKRISLGYIKSTKELDFKEGYDLFKLIVHRTKDCCISIEKVMYFYWKLVKMNENSFYHSLKDAAKKQFEVTVTDHLTNRGLISKPTEPENDILFLSVNPFFFMNPTQSIPQLERIWKEWSTELVLPDGLDELIKSLEWEIHLKTLELTYGRKRTGNSTLVLTSCTYSIPTCNGSSGCRILCCKPANRNVSFFSAVHSKGKRNMHSTSGYGAAWDTTSAVYDGVFQSSFKPDPNS